VSGIGSDALKVRLPHTSNFCRLEEPISLHQTPCLNTFTMYKNTNIAKAAISTAENFCSLDKPLLPLTKVSSKHTTTAEIADRITPPLTTSDPIFCFIDGSISNAGSARKSEKQTKSNAAIANAKYVISRFIFVHLLNPPQQPLRPRPGAPQNDLNAAFLGLPKGTVHIYH
jgi:hypothetical protein